MNKGEISMSFKCYSYFMVRTPALSIKYLNKYREQEKDIYNFIKNDEFLDSYFKKALLVSSVSLYNSYINEPKSKKKYNNLLSSLLKFFIRATTRPTPYGYFSSVSLANFDKETGICLGKSIFDIRLDSVFVDFLIARLEDRYFQKLKFKYNKNCYISGDLYKNPYLTSIRNKNKEDKTLSVSIRYTNLINIIKNNTKDFVAFESLKEILEQNYEGIEEQLVISTLKKLIDNEYLYSDIRIPSYCIDSLGYLIKKLENYNIAFAELSDLKLIQEYIENFDKNEDINNIVKIYEIIDKYNIKDYLLFNLGNELKKGVVNTQIKEKLENFVDTLEYIPKKVSYLEKFKNKFQEKYGFNSYVPLVEVIDENDFNGLNFLDEESIEKDYKEKEQKIKNIISNRLCEAIIQGEESIYLTRNNFQNLFKKEDYIGGFDLNCHIFKDKDNYQLYLGSNVGANNVGSMFQRFSNCFSKQLLEKYNEIYQLTKSDNYLEVELKEHGSSKRIRNIVNDRQICKHFLTLGNCQNSDDLEININDLYILLTYSGKLLIKSKKHNKILKFVVNNMLNSESGSKILKLLRYITMNLENNPIARLIYFSYDFDYKYVPRIVLEDVVIQLRKWNLNKEDLVTDNFESFKNSLRVAMKSYKIDSQVYLSFFDNRLLLNLAREEDINILYKEFKKTFSLKLTEVEKELYEKNIVKDFSKNYYINECVFSFYNDKNDIDIYSKYNNSSYYIKSIKQFLEDGWIYFKLYGIDERDNDILSRDLCELIEVLKIKKHFFIRYGDEEGYHLRVRLKFSNRQVALESLEKLNLWLCELKDNKLISNVIFDSYNKEVNRYGGFELVELCEEQFFTNSSLVEKYLSLFDIKNNKQQEENIYIFTILFILKNIYNDIDEINKFLEKNNQNSGYHEQYLKRKNEILEISLNSLQEKVIYDTCKEELEKERRALRNVKNKLSKLENEDTCNNLVRSLIHMACNRLTGKNEVEDKYFEFVKSAVKTMVEAKNKGIERI